MRIADSRFLALAQALRAAAKTGERSVLVLVAEELEAIAVEGVHDAQMLEWVCDNTISCLRLRDECRMIWVGADFEKHTVTGTDWRDVVQKAMRHTANASEAAVKTPLFLWTRE